MHAPDPVAFSVLGIEIRWYGLLIGLGFILAIIISYIKAPRYKINSEHFLDFCIWLIPFSVIGARLYYVIFKWEDYAGDIKAIINVRNGGLAIHGGIIAGIIVAILVCKHHRIAFFDLADLTFPQVALAQAIGRWGNFFNSEAHGGPTDLPWGIIVEGQKVHPTFLYESIWCLAIFLILTFIFKNRKFKGQIFLLYLILYSFERFFVEGLRTDSLMIGPFRQAQVLSIAVFAASILAYIYISKKHSTSKSASNAEDEDNIKGE